MALSKQKGSLYDPYREMWVAATPEEIVRQRLLHVMTHQLGFPRNLVAVEKQLSELPHLPDRRSLSRRRADILCFYEVEGELKPLLLIECKESKLTDDAKRQVLGYNHYVGAPFVALAGHCYAALIYPEAHPFIPPYQKLKEAVCI